MDKEFSVLIVDDEPIAQDILETYLEKIPGARLLGKCGNALEAFAVISKSKVDILLLDINMPELNGISFLKTLKDPPLVIFTTAYAEYAVESYELNAVDYLLKPVPFGRFLKAVNKAVSMIVSMQGAEENSLQPSAGQNILFIKSGSRLIRIDVNDICYAEGLKDYVRIWTQAGNTVVHSTMKNLEEQLQPHHTFLRIHKSYLVNLKYVSEVNGNLVKVNDQQLAIGSTYKEEVYAAFNRLKLL